MKEIILRYRVCRDEERVIQISDEDYKHLDIGDKEGVDLFDGFERIIERDDDEYMYESLVICDKNYEPIMMY